MKQHKMLRIKIKLKDEFIGRMYVYADIKISYLALAS